MKNYIKLSLFRFEIIQTWEDLATWQKQLICEILYKSQAMPYMIKKICWGIVAGFKKRKFFSFLWFFLSTDFDKKTCEEEFTKFLTSDFIPLQDGSVLRFAEPFRLIHFIRVQQLVAAIDDDNFKEISKEIVAVCYQKNKDDKYSDDAMKLSIQALEGYNEHFLLEAANRAMIHCETLSKHYERLFERNSISEEKVKTPPHVIFEKWLKTARLMAENVSQVLDILQLDCHLAFFELIELKERIKNTPKPKKR
jgi:hypothetical protein